MIENRPVLHPFHFIRTKILELSHLGVDSSHGWETMKNCRTQLPWYHAAILRVDICINTPALKILLLLFASTQKHCISSLVSTQPSDISDTYEKQLSLQQRKTTHSRALGYRRLGEIAVHVDYTYLSECYTPDVLSNDILHSQHYHL